MEDLQLVKGLVQNEISEENIKAFLKLKEEAKKLGFEFNEYDEVDGNFVISFFIPN